VALSSLEATRREWEEGHRRLEAAVSDPPRYALMRDELELVLDGLRRHVGQRFTLDELAGAYADADRWIQQLLAERDAAPGWPSRMTIVQDAAFHLYSRGAVDYRP
jgi:hypothetical protein